MLAVKELSESSASSLTVVRARWSCRALTVTWAYTAPPAGTHIHTHSHQYPHITHLHTSLMDYSSCDSQVIYPCTPPSPSSSQFLAPPLFISLGLSLMARVNWLPSNCCSLAWVTKHVRRNKQKLPPLARLCAGFFFLILQFPFQVILAASSVAFCAFTCLCLSLHLSLCRFTHPELENIRKTEMRRLDGEPNKPPQHFRIWTIFKVKTLFHADFLIYSISIYCCVILCRSSLHAYKLAHKLILTLTGTGICIFIHTY